ncbi:capsular exopolysaccharide synthesis family protein [Mucilaginibacter gracilis]|uniref:non-specific protein-tyrosine kinase n=1 Tax=Mucilaginibacter gracilis TaxID=423350 RepID=A0A495IXG6_9SPHI|nr:polysaccharide biosynthesis tyrosine autokinase [Mucilaginibacter gracilis]RKR81081.1 capsular exopolysaccharide synthesis family protein [Mucilaginibacter gracilis]
MPSAIDQSGNKPSQRNDDDVIDFKQIISVVIKHWYLFVLSIAICSVLAFVYAYYASAEWSASAKILVDDSKNNPSSAASASGLGSDFGSLFNVKSSADNEVQILKSRSLMENTVKQLQLNVRVFSKEGLKETEIYQECPFSIKLNYKADTLFVQKYNIKFDANGQYTITNSKENVNETARVGQTIKLKNYDFVLNPITNRLPTGSYTIKIVSVDDAVAQLSNSFIAALSDKQATTIDLSLSYPQPKKSEVILEEIMKLYLQSNLQNKVQIADSTIEFINSRINLVGKELNEIEGDFESYKTRNGIADISTQSKVLVSSANDYYDKLNQTETQLKVIQDLEKVLHNPQNKSVIPSSMVAPNDVAFGQSINTYNEMLIQRDKASLAYTNNNPIIQNYDQQIETARQTLLRSITSFKSNLQTSESELKRQNGNVNNKLLQVPAKERGYLDIQRKQALKQDLYQFLLQKREETAISKTSTISSSRIIDHAKSDFYPFKPKKSIIFLVGIFLGLVLPTAYLFIKELLNIKINSKQDVVKATNATIVGEIGHNEAQETLVAINHSRTIISEQFRSLRTKLNYLLNTSKPNVILFTSSMGGEGKSFLSVNLGSALALTGKKVVFIELDLRKPKLSEIMGHDHNTFGYSNYAVSEFTDINKLIKPIWFDENCSLISSGPIPPNPTELLTNPKLERLINELKTKFDYIIIDCAPVGLVTDALIIEKLADLTFYVVREKHTYKEQINIINSLRDTNEIRNLYIILNDIKINRNSYSSYGYGLEKPQKWTSKLKVKRN